METLPKELKQVFNLDHNVKIYVPSTRDVYKTISEKEQRKYIDATLEKMSSLFGGATAHDAVGAWQAKNGALVTESVTIVESYATAEQIRENIGQVLQYAQLLKGELKQEAISLEYDNRLFFI